MPSTPPPPPPEKFSESAHGSCSLGLVNQGDKPLENLTGNIGVQGMIYSPDTYFSFPIWCNWPFLGMEGESPAGV